MRQYFPDKWVMIKITHKDATYYKVLASWYGGYTGGDSWKLSSGTKKAINDGDTLTFPQVTDSEYVCHKDTYGTSGYTACILNDWLTKLEGTESSMEVMEHDTDFTSLEYGL